MWYTHHCQHHISWIKLSNITTVASKLLTLQFRLWIISFIKIRKRVQKLLKINDVILSSQHTAHSISHRIFINLRENTQIMSCNVTPSVFVKLNESLINSFNFLSWEGCLIGESCYLGLSKGWSISHNFLRFIKLIIINVKC